MAKLGFLVTVASNGDKALAVLASNEAIDLILTDYAMVGMDGSNCWSRQR